MTLGLFVWTLDSVFAIGFFILIVSVLVVIAAGHLIEAIEKFFKRIVAKINRPSNKEISTSLLKPTQAEIASACLYYDHSYGLMGDDQRKKLEQDAAEWFSAWRKAREDADTNKKKFPKLDIG
jgi:hypothetical protein